MTDIAKNRQALIAKADHREIAKRLYAGKDDLKDHGKRPSVYLALADGIGSDKRRELDTKGEIVHMGLSREASKGLDAIADDIRSPEAFRKAYPGAKEWSRDDLFFDKVGKFGRIVINLEKGTVHSRTKRAPELDDAMASKIVSAIVA